MKISQQINNFRKKFKKCVLITKTQASWVRPQPFCKWSFEYKRRVNFYYVSKTWNYYFSYIIFILSVRTLLWLSKYVYINILISNYFNRFKGIKNHAFSFTHTLIWHMKKRDNYVKEFLFDLWVNGNTEDDGNWRK